MGQLQKRFEDQSLAQFEESTEAKITWGGGESSPEKSSQTVSLDRKPTQLKIRALQLGLILIVLLSLILVFG